MMKTIFVSGVWCLALAAGVAQSEMLLPETGTVHEPVLCGADVGGDAPCETGWVVLRLDDESLEPVGQFANVEDALAVMRHGCRLYPSDSQGEHQISVASDGSGVMIDDVFYSVREHYLYVEDEGVPMLVIDPCEAEVTYFGEDPEDPELMILRTVDSSCYDFCYSVVWADDIMFSEDPGESESQQGMDGALEFKVLKGDKGRRFYKIRVTDDF